MAKRQGSLALALIGIKCLNILRWVQVLAVLDIIYLTACVYKPYKVLRDITSQPRPGISQSAPVSHQITFTHAMLYVEIAARSLASVSQTAIVWVVVMVTIDRYLAVCQPMVDAGLRTLRCVQRAVFVVVVAALIYNIPIFFENKVGLLLLLNSTKVISITDRRHQITPPTD